MLQVEIKSSTPNTQVASLPVEAAAVSVKYDHLFGELINSSCPYKIMAWDAQIVLKGK